MMYQLFMSQYDGAELAVAPRHSSLNGQITENGTIHFRVRVKADCEEDDPEANKVRERSFAVSLTKTTEVPFSQIMNAIRGGNTSTEYLTMIINLILKSSAKLSGMILLDPRSPTVYFPLTEQERMIGRRGLPEARDGTSNLIAGVSQTAAFTKNEQIGSGGAFVVTQTKVNWADKEYWRLSDNHDDDRNWIPLLLNGRNPRIAGVPIISTEQPLDKDTINLVEKALAKIRFNIRYTIIKSDAERDKAMRARGKTQAEIEDSRRKVFKDQGISKDINQDPHVRIMRSARDYTFKWNDIDITVSEYYLQKYGIQLQYPNMPIVHVKKGWFPAEFLHQKFARSNDANDRDMIDQVLRYYDGHAGSALMQDVIEKRRTLLNQIRADGLSLASRLNFYNLRISDDPTCLKAKIIQTPAIKFRNERAQLRDGDFNLKDAIFSKPAALNSFVVVNFARNNQHSCADYVQTMLRVAVNHGIEIPYVTMEVARNYLENVTVLYSGSHPVNDALDAVGRAIEMAKKVYIHDSLNIFRRNNDLFKTFCYNECQCTIECAVLPPRSVNGSVGLLLDYNKLSSTRNPNAMSDNMAMDRYFSHKIKRRNGEEHYARLKIRITQTDTRIDPLDFRFSKGRHEAIRRSNGEENWVTVNFIGYCYECRDTKNTGVILDVVEEHDVEAFSYIHNICDWEVECPSLIISYHPDKDKALYDKVKCVTNQIGGYQSQIAVAETFERQKNKNQYASAVLTKLNAKLSNPYNKAVSWKSICEESVGDVDSIPWVAVKPTLVVGIGMAHGLGNCGKTVVAASVCLDGGCMRLSHCCFLQQKSDIISTGNIKDIIKTSWKEFTAENEKCPERILIYRDGMSDGNFERADGEIANIRSAISEILSDNSATIPITYVICQSQHNIRMVPKDETQGNRRGQTVNVYSGTCLDHTVMEFGALSVTENERNNYDFLLTPQAGIKGTSKPIYFRVRINENSDTLNKQTLEWCTYHMCWKYPTATKAVREVPAVKYAKRLANQVLSGLENFRYGGSTWFGKTFELINPQDADENGEIRPYIRMTTVDGEELGNMFNVVDLPFRHHLAA
mmetsp:Transcript_13807/g.27990  ORF Transcript_13807/g.27990 Transcript_13807/m.27990 type:complete len:1077 (+) Transcript_13807:697-3927(+)